MEAQYKTRSGQLIVKIEGRLFLDIIRGISEVEEVLRNDKCGLLRVDQRPTQPSEKRQLRFL